jgi:hypothetical protein
LGGGITIDGFISGAVSKKMGLTVESVKSETGVDVPDHSRQNFAMRKSCSQEKGGFF